MTTTSPAWTEAIDSWRLALRAGGRAESSIRTRTDHLHWLASWAGERSPWALTTTDLNDWAGAKSWANETRRSVRSSLRSFYGWALEAGHVAASPASHLASVKPAQPLAHPTPSDAYVDALARARPRERLMLRLAAEYGMRRGEVAQVSTHDLDTDSDGYLLRVHGKGNKIRVIPIRTEIAAAIREAGTGYVFPGDDGGHLSPRWVGTIVARLLPGEWTMHSLRHRFATRMYALDRDVFVVQELLGHASPATTRRYVRLPQGAKRDAINRLADAA